MAVRSRRFFGPAGPSLANTWTEMWQVPTDRVARFSWLSVVNISANPQTCYLASGTGGVVSVAFWEEIVPAQSARLLGAGLILEDDDELWFYATSTSCHVLGCGSLLLGDPA